MDTYFVSIDINEAQYIVEDAILRGSITGELIDSYAVNAQGGSFIVKVYEKHYLRAENRLTLTVVFDNFAGSTRVHCTGGGGGQGFFRFDWGAADNFERAVTQALAPYRI